MLSRVSDCRAYRRLCLLLVKGLVRIILYFVIMQLRFGDRVCEFTWGGYVLVVYWCLVSVDVACICFGRGLGRNVACFFWADCGNHLRYLYVSSINGLLGLVVLINVCLAI